MTRTALLLTVLLPLAGCERAMQNMYDQPRYKPLAAAPELPGGTSAQPLPADSIIHSRGNLAATASGSSSEEESARDAAATRDHLPSPLPLQLVERGRNRYSIYCVPCHSPIGDGDGLVAQRGFPRPPSYHSARLRQAPDRHFYDVISNGYGIMYSYAERVSPEDRWAIVAYIRALQLSQNAPADALPADLKGRVEASR